LIVGIGYGELGACGEAGAECEEKQCDGEDEGFPGRARENRDVKLRARGNVAPIYRGRERIDSGI